MKGDILSNEYIDDVDIRFSQSLSSYKLPQVRYATPERLLERLTGNILNTLDFNAYRHKFVSITYFLSCPDLRFLSIDFLNTFLLTYRVFTNGKTVLESLKKVFHEAKSRGEIPDNGEQLANEHLTIPGHNEEGIPLSPRRTSGASSGKIKSLV